MKLDSHTASEHPATSNTDISEKNPTNTSHSHNNHNIHRRPRALERGSGGRRGWGSLGLIDVMGSGVIGPLPSS